jgi:hypothetical protein
MVEDNTAHDNPEVTNTTPAMMRAQRFRSEIEFPYADLQTAVELVEILHRKAATSCDDNELAAWMNQSATGGTFRSRLAAARIFGLVETGQGRVSLTTLGRGVVDSSTGRDSLSEAFLKPQLFSAMYEQVRGHVLPPPPAIERHMEGLGVSPKQKDRARQTFVKSAQYAGFIDQTSGRFVKPGNAGSAPPAEATKPKKSGGGGGGSELVLDPLLMALLHKIPPKEEGWAAAKRVRWFRTFAMNVSQIYDNDDDPVELKIEVSAGGNQP